MRKLFNIPESASTGECRWRSVKGYEGLYEVSSLGEVRRIGQNVLKPYRGQVYLSKDGNVSTIRVSKLVAEGFLEGYTPDTPVFHLSGNSDAVSNLSIVSPEVVDDEIWKSIPGYEGSYQASRYGKIRSVGRLVSYNGGVVFRDVHELKLHVGADGYEHCMLSVRGESKLCSVHRLVASAFIPNPGNLPQVNHRDGNKINNNVENLEWVTNIENLQHSIELGLRNPKVCGELSKQICGIPVRCVTDGTEYRSLAEAALRYNLDSSTIKRSASEGVDVKGLQFELIEGRD